MKNIFSLGLLALTLAGATQAAERLTFHLPVEAQWGTAVLPAGDYQISLPQPSKGIPQLTVKSDTKSRFVIPLTTELKAEAASHSDHSYLSLVKVNGAYFISQFRSSAGRTTFTFVTPKSHRDLEMVAQEQVEVDASGN